MFASKSRRFFTSAALVVSAVSVAAVSVAAAQRLFADITGTWIVSGQSPNGATESTAIFKQTGTELTGSLDIPDIGFAKLSGTVKGDTVNFGFTLDMQGTPLPVQVSGVLKDKDNMSGMISLPQDMGNYPYTAKRKP